MDFTDKAISERVTRMKEAGAEIGDALCDLEQHLASDHQNKVTSVHAIREGSQPLHQLLGSLTEYDEPPRESYAKARSQLFGLIDEWENFHKTERLKLLALRNAIERAEDTLPATDASRNE